MEIKLQFFGGRGIVSGGSFRGSHKSHSTHVPNSKYTWYKNGEKYQERWYDKDGKPKKDRDYTDHGNPKRHPKIPHDHDWKNGKRGDWY